MPDALVVVVAVVLVLTAAGGVVLVQAAQRAAAFRRMSRLSRTMAWLHGGAGGGRRRTSLREPLPTVRPVVIDLREGGPAAPADGPPQEVRGRPTRGPSRSHQRGASTRSARSPTRSEPSIRA